MSPSPLMTWTTRITLYFGISIIVLVVATESPEILVDVGSLWKAISNNHLWLLFLFFVVPAGFKLQAAFERFAYRTSRRCTLLILVTLAFAMWAVLGFGTSNVESLITGSYSVKFGSTLEKSTSDSKPERKYAETAGIFAYQPKLFNIDGSLSCNVVTKLGVRPRRYRICYVVTDAKNNNVPSIQVNGCTKPQDNGAAVNRGQCIDFTDAGYLYVSRNRAPIGTFRIEVTELRRLARIFGFDE